MTFLHQNSSLLASAVAALALTSGFAGLSATGASAAVVAGGCTPASAPVIVSGATQTSDASCPDGAYWAITLKIGDVLTVNAAANQSIYTVGVYGPDSATAGTPLCEADTLSSTRLDCLIGVAGTYAIGTQQQGSFTVSVESVPPRTARVAGACDPANAHTAAFGVTQYVNTDLCASGASYWKVRLRRGDVVKVNLAANQSIFDVGIYGPKSGAAGTPLCSGDTLSSTHLRCRIRVTGTYLLGAQHQGSFTPTVVRASH